jgi:hypothetical protein
VHNIALFQMKAARSCYPRIVRGAAGTVGTAAGGGCGGIGRDIFRSAIRQPYARLFSGGWGLQERLHHGLCLSNYHRPLSTSSNPTSESSSNHQVPENNVHSNASGGGNDQIPKTKSKRLRRRIPNESSYVIPSQAELQAEEEDNTTLIESYDEKGLDDVYVVSSPIAFDLHLLP